MASPVLNNKVGFKVGVQSALESIMTNRTAAPGTFYLTSDTNRLYVGNSDGSVSAVNEGIITVANRAALPTASASTLGHFYYITNINALVIGCGTSLNTFDWVQVNAQSPDTHITSNTFTAVDDNDSSATYVIVSSTIEDNNSATYGGEIVIQGGNGLTVAMGTDTTVTETDSTTGLDVSRTLKTIKVLGDTLELTAALGTGVNSSDLNITLSSDNGGNTNSTVTLKAGSNVSITKDSDDKFVIAAVDNKVGSVDISPKSTTSGNETVYQNGYVVSVSNSVDGSTETEDFDPVVEVGGSSKSNIHFVNGKAALPVYTTAEIDDIMKGLNAMTYRGIIGTNTGAVATAIDSTTNFPLLAGNPLEVRVGDTFMIGTGSITYNGQTLEQNSLIIARGTENATTGLITSNLTFDYVKDTKSTDTTYDLTWLQPAQGSSAAVPSIVLQDSHSNITGEVEFEAGTNLSVSATQTAGSGSSHNTEVITFSHDTVTRTDVNPKTAQNNQGTDAVYQSGAGSSVGKLAGDALIVPVITNVASDSQGHLTGITTTNYVLQDTNARVSSVEYSASSYNVTNSTKQVGVIGNTVKDSDSTGAAAIGHTGNMTLSSDSLSIGTTNNLKANSSGTGDSLNGLSIDLVWGTFS